LNLPQEQLAAKLRVLGHRFPNARSLYITIARQHSSKLKHIFETLDEQEIRGWLADNIKGLGYKEASHFLRNIGYQNLAILDFHIIDILASNKLIKKPNTLTKSKYLEIEKVLKELAKKANLTLAELDLYLWYLETGKVLK